MKKARDLHWPFSWEERRVVIRDGVWFVPEYFDRFEEFRFGGWREVFQNENPVRVEYCSGNGEWILEKARLHPEVNWVAVEIKFERVRKIWAKKKNRGLENLLVVCGEGCATTSHYFPKNSVSEIFINFPDPWPKRVHAKHRLIKDTFVQEMWKTLCVDGSVTFVTDDPTYSEEMISHMGRNPGFRSSLEAPHYTNHYPDYGSSFFEQLWRDKGKDIRYHHFRRVHC